MAPPGGRAPAWLVVVGRVGECSQRRTGLRPVPCQVLSGYLGPAVLWCPRQCGLRRDLALRRYAAECDCFVTEYCPDVYARYIWERGSVRYDDRRSRSEEMSQAENDDPRSATGKTARISATRARYELTERLRAGGKTWSEIGSVLRERFGVNGRVALSRLTVQLRRKPVPISKKRAMAT